MRITVLYFFAVMFLFSCCSNPKKEVINLAGTIKIDGSSTVYPITEKVVEEFKTNEPSVEFTVGISGTGGGFLKFGRGETDITNASRPIKDKEQRICKENNIKYVGLTVAYDGIAIIINPENDWVDYLTLDELKLIWEPEAQMEIIKWNQIRPEWPDEEIHLYGPGIASGTYDYFTETIVGEAGNSRGDFVASEDDNLLVQGISMDKDALGFFGLAYYKENKDKLHLVPVDGGNGPIDPTIETISNGTYSPLSRPLLIYVNCEGAERPEVKSFVDFYIANAPKLVEEIGYVPLKAESYATESKKFKNFIEELN